MFLQQEGKPEAFYNITRYSFKIFIRVI